MDGGKWGDAYPSRLDVSMKQRPSGSDEEMSMRSAGMNSSDSTRTVSPTQIFFHLRWSNVEDGVSTLAIRALSSKSDWCRFYRDVRGNSKIREEQLTRSSWISLKADARRTMASGTMVVYWFVGDTFGIC